jgi:spectinomycin phosphotransferase
LAAFLLNKRADTLDLVKRAERLAQALQAQPPEFILCHGDIHGWNLLIDVNGGLYMVDWDTLIFAPKERDLMFVGGGLGDSGYTPQEEEAMFYQGYGQTNINQIAIAYYRYERIIEDIAVYCDQILLSEEGGKDRKQSLGYLKSNYLPNSTIEVALALDITMMED